jgi:hypothetical protein
MPFVNILKYYKLAAATFVPWIHIAGPDGDSSLQPLALLLGALGLERTGPPPPPVSPASGGPKDPGLPDDGELRLVAGNFGELILQDEPRRRFDDFIAILSLPPGQATQARSQWTDDLGAVGWRLMEWARRQGRLVLGCVIARVIEEAPGRDDAGKLCDILAKYGLVKSERLAELRAAIQELQL